MGSGGVLSYEILITRDIRNINRHKIQLDHV